MPRPFHPKRDIAAQDALKKTAFKCCEEERAAARRGRHLRIMFADWSAFRPDQTASAVLGTYGVRPESPPNSFANTSFCTARSSSKDGACVYLIMPKSDTQCFQAFLNALSRKFSKQDILLVLDGAPNHRFSELQHSPQYIAALPAALRARAQPEGQGCSTLYSESI